MKLAAYLKAKNMTPSAFADAAGVPASTITRLLRGERSNIGIELMARIAEASEGHVLPNDFLPFPGREVEAASAETAPLPMASKEVRAAE